jgi:hypothetical protein
MVVEPLARDAQATGKSRRGIGLVQLLEQPKPDRIEGDGSALSLADQGEIGWNHEDDNCLESIFCHYIRLRAATAVSDETSC